MKRLMLAALLAATSACWVQHSYVRDPAATDFYGELAPYGEWVDLQPYGAVWRPSPAVVGADFYPYYTGGWWTDADSGWSWHSTFNWGWIPFHHGRWVAAPAYGWVWIPGDEWSPAWVEWRVGGGNVGWVPLGPQGVTTAIPEYHPRWVFVPLAEFPRHDFHRWRLPAYEEYSAYHQATAIPFERGERRRGPGRELVQRAAGPIPRESEPIRRLPRGAVRAEPRVGPSSRRAEAGRENLPPPPPLNGRAEAMPPPPGASAPAAPARQSRKTQPPQRGEHGRPMTRPPPPP